jgi:hypothetical protein
MGRTCTICVHEDRAAIDEALATRSGSLRTVADQFRVSKTALIRHKAEHLPAKLVKAQEAKEVASASDLLAQMEDLQRRTLEILQAPESQRVAVAAIGQARANVELLAELTGKLAHQPTVNVLISAEWVTVRSALLEALLPYPEARAAVSARLAALGDGRGR